MLELTRELLACLALPLAGAPALAQGIELEIYDVEIVQRLPHDTGAYTQGLFFAGGVLYESTGQVGESSLRRVDLETGEVELSTEIAAPYFGEGSTAVGDEIFMVTWRLGAGYVYDRETLERTEEFAISGEGWGLTTDGEQLFLSDGTDVLRLLDPATREVTDRIPVRFGERAVTGINELEFIDGQIWANIYGSPEIVRIDPQTGAITGAADLSPIIRDADVPLDYDHVLNGIAWWPEEERLFVTGKYWPTLYEIRLVPRS